MIRNRSGGPVHGGGWLLVSVTGNQRLTLPDITLASGGSLAITSGSDATNLPPAVIRWTTANVWNNDGDTGELYDGAGRLVARSMNVATPAARPRPQPKTATRRCGAICRDGSRGSATGREACSHHGGVRRWIYCEGDIAATGGA